MQRFTIRVVLFDADWPEYVTLYERLRALGIDDLIQCDSGRVFKLPPGEYNYTGVASAQQVHDWVKITADSVAFNHVLVTEALNRVWTLSLASDGDIRKSA